MTISISNPKRLSTYEFESIHGSELHTVMMKNRLVIGIGYENAHNAASTLNMLTDWLLENCENLYYIVFVKGYSDRQVQYNHTIYIYFSKDTEAVHFKMRFDGNEFAEPEPQPTRQVQQKVYQYIEEEYEDDDLSDDIILEKKKVKKELAKANIMKKLLLEANKRKI